ncbi:MAG: galactose oxidase-like domain-containing protein [Candidatus Hydrogenedentes bacterium]|nr:galactose oxidase-like domain-containing protein [Candidatus Hydrogenedentota bacterium]
MYRYQLSFALCAVVLGIFPTVVARSATLQDFDKGNGICAKGATCATLTIENDPAPALFAGGPTGLGRFLRLGYASPEEIPNFNTVSFEQTDPAADLVIVDFDFRITTAHTRGDGFGFSFLDVAQFGATGTQEGAGEEPGFSNSVGVGFDIHENEDLDDLGNDSVRQDFSNSISLHFNGVRAQADVSPIIDLACGLWLHARVVMRFGGGFSDVSVLLGAPEGELEPVFDQFHIDGLAPYAGRAHFGARSGGETADVDIDNIRIEYASLNVPMFSLSGSHYRVHENSGVAEIDVLRAGDVSAPGMVNLVALDSGDAGDGSDFGGGAIQVSFAAGETVKAVPFAVTDDSDLENDELFEVVLRNPRNGAILAGPAAAGVSIIDNETAKKKGAWDRLYNWPNVAVHMHLLPNKTVAIWDRLGAAALWNPETGEAALSTTPGYNLFCSGHAFLPNGNLLITGGHADLGGHPNSDGVGEIEASLYVAETDSWLALPNMNARRWYPTNFVLPNGDVLVLSGTINGFASKNTLPQVWEVENSAWRNLTTADEGFPLGVDLYPRMFLTPDGLVFKAGMDAFCYYLDTSGTGAWIPGPTTKSGFHLYGAATQYAPGKIVTVGGSDISLEGEAGIKPNRKTEVIDLADDDPKWRTVKSMKNARRQHNATVLPDGTVLITGGTSGLGFTNPTTPVFAAEVWNPETEKWRELASMRVPRIYHSSAFLLPDGRVISAGGGQGGGETPNFQNLAEVYMPPYLFKGQRPAIVSAPETIGYGELFSVETTQITRIETVSLIRLPSVTHGYDMNQNYVPLAFTPGATALNVTAPANGIIAPPGHYMLFVVNNKGVPSVAEIVQLTL